MKKVLQHCNICFSELSEIECFIALKLCLKCYDQLEFVHAYSGRKCVNCQKKLSKGEYQLRLCQDCHYWKSHTTLPLVPNKALLYYNEFAHELMERLKFQGDVVVWESICFLMRMFVDLPRAVQPIPSRRSTYRKRDFDHLSYIVAQLRLQEHSILLKKAGIPSQLTLLNVHERRRLKSGFEVKEEAGIRTVVLFDDVYTTGSTLKDCQSALREHNIKVTQTYTIFRSDLR